MLLTHKTGKGRELREMLSRELGIPPTARSFEVRFAWDEVVTVKCEYFAEEREDAPFMSVKPPRQPDYEPRK